MQQSKQVKAMLLSAAAVGLGSLCASTAHAQNAYTWANTGAATVTWAVASNWNPNSAYPTVAGDTAFLNISLAGAQTVVLPSNLTVGTLVLGDATSHYYAQTVISSYNNMTLDNQGGLITIMTSGNSSSSAMDTIKAVSITTNGPVLFQLNTGSTNNGALRLTNASFNAAGYSVTIGQPISGTDKASLYIDENVTAALWQINSNAHVVLSGNPAQVSGDILIMKKGTLQDSDTNNISSHSLLTDNGDWNMGAVGSSGGVETIGGFTGSGSMDGASYLTIAGGSDAAGATNFSGFLYTAQFNVTGGTQILSPAAGYYGGSGSVTVSGGLLQLNGTGLAPVVTSASNQTYAGSLTISGSGVVQLLQPQQVDVNAPITLAGGKLLLSGNGETSNMPLALTAASVIDFGAGQTTANAVLQFADSSAQTWSGVTKILDWVGSLTGGGEDQLFIGTTPDLGGLLADLKFVNPNGLSGTYAATQLADGEVVPSVPEPATLGLLGLAGSLMMLRRRRA